MLKAIFLVGIGGGSGSILRYLTSVWFEKHLVQTFPLATFSVNVLGCFLMGLLVGLMEKYLFGNPELNFLLLVGFCGGFTTFSAFAYENIQLIQNQQFLWALFYTVSSVVLGLIALGLGLQLMKL